MGSTFAQNGRLVAHEEARDRGQLRLVDSLEDVAAFVEAHATVFVSHQWLGDGAPDAAGVHFAAMVDALAKLCAAHELPHASLYVWCDYCCIPQVNVTLKRLSISSILVYAPACRFFVAVAPTATHNDRGHACDAATYQRRGWCVHTPGSLGTVQ